MSVNEQLAAYRAKKAAQKEAEQRQNASFISRTLGALRNRSGDVKSVKLEKPSESDAATQKQQQQLVEQVEQNQHVNQSQHGSSFTTQGTTNQPNTPLLDRPVLPTNRGFLSRFLLNDRLVLTPHKILKCLLWLILWGLFIELQFGSVYFLLSLFYFVYTSMDYGTRDKDKPSAYSVFNPNCERLDGQFTSEQFEKELRFGATAVH